MIDMAKKKTAESDDEPNRSPAWAVFARVDPALEAQVQAYIDAQEYPPKLARVVERALKELLAKHGYWPPKNR